MLATCFALGAAFAQAPAQGQAAVGPATALYRRLGSLGLDPKQVYKVRDAALDREDIHISLDDGTIAFVQAVDGRVTGALFDGEGTVLVVPPNQVERHSLGMFTQSAVLNEHFTRAYFRFDDQRFLSDLDPSFREADEPAEFISKFDSLAKTMSEMDSLRLLLSLTRERPTASGDPLTGKFIHARFVGTRGTFDLSWDTGSSEQIAVGQSSYTDHGAYYDQWMLFPMRSIRRRDADRQQKGLSNDELYADVVQVADYKLQVKVKPPTQLGVNATLELNIIKGGDKILLFELSRYLKLSAVTMDGTNGKTPLEYIQNEALEGTQLAKRGNDLIAIVFPEVLRTGQKVTIHLDYAGEVLSEAGGGLLYVGARGAWYPNRGPTMSNFELEFSAPDEWKLLATGKQLFAASANGEETTKWATERPIPLAGFNLGKYESVTAKSGSGATQVTAYATEGVEKAFPTPASAPTFVGRGRGRATITDLSSPMGIKPARNAKLVAEKARDTIDFLSSRLGEFPYDSLRLTQMPGPDSQGWPGLVFLSSHVFLTPDQRAQGRNAAYPKSAEELIYDKLMEAHEAAHQWWGDAVFWQSYRDQWMMEALSNYCALLQIESQSPEDARSLLAYYRKGLLTPAAGQSQPRKDAGPVSFGLRLNSAPFPGAYETVTYGRGTWLIHMLRQMLRDAPATTAATRGKTAAKKTSTDTDPDAVFYSVLRGLQKKFAGKMLSTQDLQLAFEEAWPQSLRYEGKKSLDWFFEGWVNGTAIPKYELQEIKRSVAGGKNVVFVKLLQNDAPNSLVTSVPIYAQTSSGLVFVDRVFADGEETGLKLTVPAGTKKLVVDPYDTVLTTK